MCPKEYSLTNTLHTNSWCASSETPNPHSALDQQKWECPIAFLTPEHDELWVKILTETIGPNELIQGGHTK